MQRLTKGLFCYILFFAFAGSILACSDVEIVPRAAWSAGAPEVVATIATPVKHIFISHTVTPPCHTKNECSARMRSMQNYHKSIGWKFDCKLRYGKSNTAIVKTILPNYCFVIVTGWGDIGYNFVIGGDGRVYEGVGWSREGVHTYAWNKKSYGIAFVGNYMTVKPNDGMLRAAKNLIICGVKMGVIAEDRWLHGARDATCTASPGDELYAIIKQWPRFQGGPLSVYNCH